MPASSSSASHSSSTVLPAAVGLRRSTAFIRLDRPADLVDAMAQMIGDLLHQRVAEHPALLGGEDLLAVGDLGLERVEDLSEGLRRRRLR